MKPKMTYQQRLYRELLNMFRQAATERDQFKVELAQSQDRFQHSFYRERVLRELLDKAVNRAAEAIVDLEQS